MKSSKLYFRYGTMNTGKTTILIQVAYNYEERGMKVFLGKSSLDTKGDNYVVSRVGIKRKIDCLIDPKMNIYEYIEKNYLDYDCILIDEAQFLTKEQVDQLLKVAVMLNIPVICYGLRTDVFTNGFTGSTRLLEVAHTIEELKTICKCGKKAHFNLRFINGEVDKSGEQVVIDNDKNVEYIPYCARCYFEEIEK